MSEEPGRREQRPRPRAAPRPLGVFARRVARALWRPVQGLARSLRLLSPGRKGVEKAPRWRYARPMTLAVRVLTTIGGPASALRYRAGHLHRVPPAETRGSGRGGSTLTAAAATLGTRAASRAASLITFLTLAFAAAAFPVPRRVRRGSRTSNAPATRRRTWSPPRALSSARSLDVTRSATSSSTTCGCASPRRPHVVIGGVGIGKTAVLLSSRAARREPRCRYRSASGRPRHLNFEALAMQRFIAEVASSSLSDAEAERVGASCARTTSWSCWPTASTRHSARTTTARREALSSGDAAADRDNHSPLAIRDAHKRGSHSSSRHALTRRSSGSMPRSSTRAAGRGSCAGVYRGWRRHPRRASPGLGHRDGRGDRDAAYLEIAHELNDAGLLGHAAPADEESRLDTRNVDRASLRVGLLSTWTAALIDRPLRAAASDEQGPAAGHDRPDLGTGLLGPQERSARRVVRRPLRAQGRWTRMRPRPLSRTGTADWSGSSSTGSERSCVPITSSSRTRRR